MSKRAIKELDRALGGAALPTDEELAALFEMGQQIRGAYSSFTPEHHAQRVMFVQAVADRSRATWSRFVAPAAVTAALLFGVLFIGRTALPGETFYPVREVLRTVGLAPASTEEVERFFTIADRLLDRAEAVSTRSPEASERLAFAASRIIGSAEAAFGELDVDDQAGLADELADLIARAEAILTEDPAEDTDRDADGKPAVSGNHNRRQGSGGRANEGPDKSRGERGGNDNAPRNRSGAADRDDDKGDQAGDRSEEARESQGGGPASDDEDGTEDEPKEDDEDKDADDKEDVDTGHSGKGGDGGGQDDDETEEPEDEPTVDVEEIRKPAVPGRRRPRG